ncbi:MAG: RNA polymerase sigma-70 factor [Bacteroidales bacterium]|nr:RNA polymerase sigma-70 factor [Bacteroidales bacterium]
MKNNNTEILKKIRFDDIKEFESLFRKYYSVLCFFAKRYVTDADIAEEIVQDMFYKLWEKRNKLKIKTSIKSYLFRAIYNNCLQYIRHKKIEDNYRKNININENINNPSEELKMKELYEIINKTLSALPERCSQIFKLSRFEGLKYHEIAQRLSISVKTVEANMGKALKQFRHSLKDYAVMLLF